MRQVLEQSLLIYMILQVECLPLYWYVHLNYLCYLLLSLLLFLLLLL